MKTVPLRRQKSEILREHHIRRYGLPEEMTKAVLIGTGYVSQKFLKNVDSKWYPYKFVLVMDSKGALYCKDGIERNEVKYILESMVDKKINLNEVHIPGKRTNFYKVPRDRDKLDMLGGLDEFSQLIVLTPSSYPRTKTNRKYVDIAVKDYEANVVTATKNIFNGNGFFRKTMGTLKKNKKYAAFNAALGVASLIPTFISPHSGDIHRIDAILNASTNMYIQLLEEGYNHEQAVDQLVAYGSLEPGGKIGGEGEDIQRKLGNLLNVIQYRLPEGAEIENPQLSSFDENLIQKWVSDANNNGKRVKIAATIWTERKGDSLYIKSKIGPKEIDDNDSLADINGLNCGFAYHARKDDNPIPHFGIGAGNLTGNVVYADSVAIHNLNARDLCSNVYTGPLIDLKNYPLRALRDLYRIHIA